MWRSLGGFGDEPSKRLTRKQLRDAFSKLDANGDGYVGVDELTKAIAATRPGVSSATIATMLREVDVDRDGFVTFGEYAQIMSAQFTQF